MNKNECRVGMLVNIIGESAKAVVIKSNPKRARIKIVQGSISRFSTHSVWNVPYSHLNPLVSGDDSDHSMMVMKSFEEPGSTAVKAYMTQAEKANLPLGELNRVDELIVEAIHELYETIDNFFGPKRYNLSNKINLLFSALGREVSKEAAEGWIKSRVVQ